MMRGFLIMMFSILAIPCLTQEINKDYTVSWIGNSFSGALKWVQQDIEDIYVMQDGTVYTILFWDEGGGEITAYKNGDILGIADHTHGWGYNGGSSIAVNSKYLYFGQVVGNEGGNLVELDTWPPKGFNWFGISRRLLSDIKKPAPFPGGKGGNKGDTLKGAFLPINEVPETTNTSIAGIYATDTHIYVSCPYDSTIRIYNAESMEPITSWSMERPGRLWIDSEGKLWVIQKGDKDNPSKILRFSTDGKLLPQQIVLSKEVEPTDICIDSRNRIFVSDTGLNQQVLIYSNIKSSPELSETFGVKGGIYSGNPGEFKDLKFRDPAGVGVDKAGNIYVANKFGTTGGSTVLESYTDKGKLNWRLFGLHFIDCADIDPTSPNETDVYTREDHFVIDYDNPIGKQWTYKGYTVDRFKYPEDPRIHIWSGGGQIKWIKGKKFLVINTMHMESYLQVYRFDSSKGSETTIPSVLFVSGHQNREGWPPHQPENGEWIWRDSNGNGSFDPDEYVSNGDKNSPGTWGIYIDDDGNLWQATVTEGIRKFPLQGLDTYGNPIWDYKTMQTLPMPEPFTEIRRIQYDAKDDVMYLGGWTVDHPYDNHNWKELGQVVIRYDNWSTDKREIRYQLLTPWDTMNEVVTMSMSVAGDYLFLGETFKGGNIHVYNKDSGEHVLDMTTSSEIGRIGWVDIPYGYHARKRANGEYLIFVEDDWKSKVLMYRWDPKVKK
jgi:hypothetical protein